MSIPKFLNDNTPNPLHIHEVGTANPSYDHSYGFQPVPPPLTAKQVALNNILEKLGKAVDERDNVSIDALSKAYQRINSFN